MLLLNHEIRLFLPSLWQSTCQKSPHLSDFRRSRRGEFIRQPRDQMLRRLMDRAAFCVNLRPGKLTHRQNICSKYTTA